MTITAAIVQTILLVTFLISGAGKIYGLPSHIHNFERLQLPQWLRVVTGMVQLIGSAGLAVGYFYSHWATMAAIYLTLTMIGAIMAHMRIKDRVKQTAPAIVLLFITVIFSVYTLSDSLNL
ncbi:DoxX family protein [Paenibacillus sp. GCM10012307]|uniref:DoxX family protein n=1 Tax=Paenibacillus roseus TaxID=2798579 RepID=A0A934J6B2_9BACL|nr:DoxX family protein [Paenibacillus roseus]MBJ6364079.1 DoxX family protein [Paenibacillus roseus]